MSGRAIPFEKHAGQQLYVWCDGTPSGDDIADAPLFTLFPGAKKVTGPLPLEAPETLEWDEDRISYAFLGSRDDCPYCDDDRVKAVVKSFYGGDLEHFPDALGELVGEPITLRDGTRTKVGQDASLAWALQAGYSIWKVPDSLDDPGIYMLFVIDLYQVMSRERGREQYGFLQTVEYDRIRAACGRAPSIGSSDMDVINRHRASIGMGPIDPLAGWTAEELREMAERIRTTGRMSNPRRKRKRNETPVVDMAVVDVIDRIRTAAEKYRAADYKQANAAAVVFLFDRLSDADAVRTAIVRWSKRDGFVLRIPHFTVSLAGLMSEAQNASGGVLLLQDFDEFKLLELGKLRKRVIDSQLPVLIVGTAVQAAAPLALDNAKELGAPVVGADLQTLLQCDSLGLFLPSRPGQFAQDDLELINRHRASIGMGPIDTSAGWTPSEIHEMAQSIRETGRMANPIHDLKLRTMP